LKGGDPKCSSRNSLRERRECQKLMVRNKCVGYSACSAVLLPLASSRQGEFHRNISFFKSHVAIDRDGISHDLRFRISPEVLDGLIGLVSAHLCTAKAVAQSDVQSNRLDCASRLRQRNVGVGSVHVILDRDCTRVQRVHGFELDATVVETPVRAKRVLKNSAKRIKCWAIVLAQSCTRAPFLHLFDSLT